MGCLGNALWFLCCGLYQGLAWCLAGALWCVTIVGIPVGLQCFKLAGLSFFPFGKDVRYGGGGRILPAEPRVGNRERYPAGVGRRAERCAPLRHGCGDPVRPAVLQAGQAGVHAFWLRSYLLRGIAKIKKGLPHRQKAVRQAFFCVFSRSFPRRCGRAVMIDHKEKQRAQKQQHADEL